MGFGARRLASESGTEALSPPAAKSGPDTLSPPAPALAARRRGAGAGAMALVTAIAAALCLAPPGAARARARAAGSASVNDTGHLRLVKSFGSVLIEQGSTSGTLPGYAKVRMDVGQVVTATFSIATRSGTIYGSGRATLHSSGRYASFGGTLTVSHGSGRYARARGRGNLYGVIDRRTDALTVQTRGRLEY